MIQCGKVENFQSICLAVSLSTRGFMFSTRFVHLFPLMFCRLGWFSTIVLFKCKDNKFIFFIERKGWKSDEKAFQNMVVIRPWQMKRLFVVDNMHVIHRVIHRVINFLDGRGALFHQMACMSWSFL